LKRRQTEPHAPSPTAGYIPHLEAEVTWLRAEYAFLKGKCERLELAIMSYSTPPAKDYVERSEARTSRIEEPIQTETPKTFRQVEEEWSTLTPEQQQERIDGKV
jgi:hypothetical protein